MAAAAIYENRKITIEKSGHVGKGLTD